MGVILLVDDNAIQLRVREAILRSAGFSISVATTAESALATLHTLGDRISVIITDHVMPGRSGADFVRLLRADNDWVPVIVLSGMPEAAPEYDDLNVTFRQKPLPPPELIELVRNTMEKDAHRGAA